MKNKKKNFLVCCIIPVSVFLISFSADAVDNHVSALQKHQFSLGLDVGHMTYSENIIDIDGFLYGLSGQYRYHGANKFILNANLSFVGGGLEYDGETWGGVPLKADSDDWIIECRGFMGYQLTTLTSKSIVPYLGFGYRYWNNQINNAGGYEREIQYLYLPIGITINHQNNVDWTWGFTVEYDVFLKGNVKSHFSDLNPDFNNPENDQDLFSGFGIGLSFHWDKKINQRKIFSIEPYFRYWSVDDSDIAALTENGVPILYVIEPENDTKHIGIRFIYRL